jgi:hypothetical protein
VISIGGRFGIRRSRRLHSSYLDNIKEVIAYVARSLDLAEPRLEELDVAK